eukprot:13824252-Ditylum_brightwellii.AAC.1
MARWMGFAQNSGNGMTYYIKTEEDKPNHLACLIIVRQRKNIGTVKECEIELDFLNHKEEVIKESEEVNTRDQALIGSLSLVDKNLGDENAVDQEKDSGGHISEEHESGDQVADEISPIEGGGGYIMNEIYDKIDGMKDNWEFETLVDHCFEKGLLKLKARYYSDMIGEDNVIDVSFNILKKDAPVALARCNGVYNDWAIKIPKSNTRTIRWMHQIKEIDRGFRIKMDNRT